MHRMRNKAAYQTLAAYLRGGRLPHALLVEGPAGAGRDAFVSTLARAVLCSAEGEARPCGQCKSCVKAEKEIHPDILRYGGEGGARSFHIDTVRRVRQEAFIRPNEAEGKVLILQDVQSMSVQAQNALLKILEEPPGRVTFLLTCENKSALLETVLSRVASIPLEGGDGDDSPEEGGADVIGLLYDACIGDELAALAVLSAYERDRPGLSALLDKMRALLGGAMLRGHDDERIRRLLSGSPPLRLLEILAIIEDTAAAVDRNANGLLLVTSLCGRLRAVLSDS